MDHYKGKNIALIFEKTAQYTLLRLKWQRMISEWDRLIWIEEFSDRQKKYQRYGAGTRTDVRWDRDTADSDRRSWKNWQNTRAFRYGTV